MATRPFNIHNVEKEGKMRMDVVDVGVVGGGRMLRMSGREILDLGLFVF